MGQTRGRVLKISDPYTFTRYIARNATIVARPPSNYSLQQSCLLRIFVFRCDPSTKPQPNVGFSKLKTTTQSQASRPDETEVLPPRTVYGLTVYVVHIIGWPVRPLYLRIIEKSH